MDYILQGFLKALQLLLTGDAATYSAIKASLVSTLLSLGAALLLGIPAGFLLGYANFPGRRALRLASDTLLSFPTVLIGLLVYALLSRRGPLGDLGLLFTLPGLAIGQAVLALPIVISLTAQAVQSLDNRVKFTLLTLGASRGQLALGCFHETRFALILAGVTAFGRVITEVGIAMMVGGNIKWETRTITTAIALETGKGEFASGIALGLVLLLLAFAVNLGLGFFKRQEAQ